MTLIEASECATQSLSALNILGFFCFFSCISTALWTYVVISTSIILLLTFSSSPSFLLISYLTCSLILSWRSFSPGSTINHALFLPPSLPSSLPPSLTLQLSHCTQSSPDTMRSHRRVQHNILNIYINPVCISLKLIVRLLCSLVSLISLKHYTSHTIWIWRPWTLQD